MTLSHLDLTTILREELEKVLAGPCITWNMKGIINAYDRAVVRTAFRVADLEREEARP